jgi:hypothetical protein
MTKGSKKREAGVEFLKGILDKIPEEKRQAIEEALKADEIVDHIGDGALRQSDYSRAMDETREQQKVAEAEKAKYTELYDNNVQWLTDQKAGIVDMQSRLKDRDDELARLRKAGDDGDFGEDTPPIDVSKFVSKAEFDAAVDKRVAGLERDAMTIIPLLNQISLRHFKTYGEVLDGQELFKHAQTVGLPLAQAYEDMTKDLAAKQQTDEIEAKLEAARKEGFNEAMAKAREGGGLPYPVTNNEPTTMDGLGKEGEFGVEAALDEYYASQKPPSAS